MQEKLGDILLNANGLNFYKSGVSTPADIDAVMPHLTELFDRAYFAPALAVVTPKDFEKLIKKGYWVEFCYSRTRTFADMPFDKLIIEIKPKMLGFNILRNYEGQYNGRCFYLNLQNNTTNLYNYLLDTLKN
ncbi:MAG: hypothetical protein IKB42_02340 [Clostridia bacterium]|nr:hypothetical protein [Clostridia bacterium]